MSEANQNQITPTPAQPVKAAKQPEQVGLRVSLIPAEEINRRDPLKGFKTCLIASGAGFFVILAIIGYLGISIFLARQDISKIAAQTAAYDSQSASLADSLKDAKLTQSRLRALSSLLGSHRNTAPILVFLQQHTLPDVAFSSISIAENGTVNLAAAAGSFESYAAQINEFRAQKYVQSLVTSGLSPIYNSDGSFQQVNFSLSINFDQAIFVSQTGLK